MTRFLTRFALAFTLAAGLIAATSTAFAESGSQMTVTVPFAFTANHVSLAAGTYSVFATENYVKLTNTSTDKTLVLITRRDDGTANHGPSRLTFHRRYGQTYLTQIWTAGSSLHSEMVARPKPNREIGQVTMPETTFEIAMK